MDAIPNLLPQSVRNQRLVSVGLKRWSCVWLLAGLSTLVFCAQQQRHVSDLEIAAVRLSAMAAPVRDLQKEQRKLQLEIAAIRERESRLVESDSRQALQLLGIISSAAATNNGRISVQSLKLTSIEREIAGPENKAKSGKKKQKEAEVEQRMQLELSGIAVDDLTVASFVAGLRESAVFESVELKSSVRQIVDNHDTRQYDVTCIY